MESLHLKIKEETPYAIFYAGDLNGPSQSWYPEGDTNAEGLKLDNLFSNLNLTQIISEPTHFMRDNCKPSCIDLIITDQPNLVLDSGVRGSLDPAVKHQIVFCKINFNLPPPPKYKRKIWHFNRASSDMIEKAISSFPWADNFQNLVPTEQVDLLNRTILNIMAKGYREKIQKERVQK